MSLVFTHQIEATEKSVGELESEIRQRRRGAMRCFDVEDLVRSEITLFEDIKESVARWLSYASSTPEDGSDELWLSLYRRLEAVFGKTAVMVAEVEEQGFSLSGKVEFLTAWRGLRAIVCFDHDRLAKSIEQASKGELIPLHKG